MSPFFVRLALLGSRHSFGRLAGVVAGIAVGMAMLLLLLGAFTALDRRELREAWVGANGTVVAATDPAVVLDRNTALLARVEDVFRGKPFTRLDVAATPDTAVVVPGVGAPPPPGTYFASPALAALIDATPPDQLADRFGQRAGIIADDALSSPDSLVAVVGADATTLREGRRSKLITSFDATPPGASIGYQIVLMIGAVGLFFPVILFVTIVTKLGAAERRERFATLRLLGASPRQLELIASLETLFTSTLGALLGVALAFLLRPLAAQIPLNGGSFFPADLALPGTTVAMAVVVMVVVSTAATTIGIKRLGISPLGVTRQRRERAPRIRRSLVLLTGLALLASPNIAIAIGSGENLGILLPFVMVGGFFLTALGIVLIGPWLTFRLSGRLARITNSAAGVIAGSRIPATPVATFRSVSGLVVAVFMVSVFAGAAGSAFQATAIAEMSDRMPLDALFATIRGTIDEAALRAAAERSGADEAIVGYDAVAFDHALSRGTALVIAADDARRLGFESVPTADFVAFDLTTFVELDAEPPTPMVAANLTNDSPAAPRLLILRTDGTADTIERVRTAIERATDATVFLQTRAEFTQLGDARAMRELAFVAYLGAFVSIAIAGCSLAIATASAMIDRRRVLGLMRLMGMPAGQLRRIVGLEAAVPLVAVLVVSVVLGLLVAWLILGTLSGELSFTVPEPAYFVTLAVGLALALAAVGATFRLVSRSTAIGTTRFE